MDSADDLDETLDLPAAAEHLGVSPSALLELLDRGVLTWLATSDVWHRRIALRDLDAYREARFARQQDLARQARARRPDAWTDDWRPESGPPPEAGPAPTAGSP